MIEHLGEETFLGDGLYAHYDGFALWLRAPRADGTDHVVALEPVVMHNFIEFALTIPRHAKIVQTCVREKVADAG